MAMSALTPVAVFADETETPAAAATGFYTANSFITPVQFKALTLEEQRALLSKEDLVLVVSGSVYFAKDALGKSDAELEEIVLTEAEFEATYGELSGSGYETSPVAELKVESVSAINDITVAFGEESAQTVLAGLPTTVKATLNDEETTEVTLDVEWAADANYDENVAGVYTFTGKVTLPADVDYTISEEISTVNVKVTVEAATEEQITSAIAAVNEAVGAADLLVALQSPVLGLTNVDENVDYTTEIDDSFTTTKAQIQAAVNRANAAATEANAEFIKAVNEATGKTALETALNALGINNVITNPSQGLAYFAAIAANTTETKAQIQAVIDQVNLTELTKLVVAAEKSVKATDVVTAKTLLDAYSPVDTGDVTTVADFQARLDVVTALVAVNAQKAASDSGVNLLTALKGPALNLKNVVDVNANEYLVAFKARVTADTNFEFATVSALQTFVNKVNTDKGTGFITAVNTAGAGSVASDFAGAINSAGVATVSTANDAAYLAAFKAKVAADSKFKFTTVAEITAFVKAVNTAETEKALLTAVNEAPANGIEAALTAFVGTYNNDAYVNLTSTSGQKNEVARLFRGIKADTTYKTIEEVQAALTSATEQYNTALSNVLNAKSIAETRTTLQAVYDLALTYFTEEEIAEIDSVTVTVEQAETLFSNLEIERAKETPVLPKNFGAVITAATPA